MNKIPDHTCYMDCDWLSRSSCTLADDISYMDYDWFSRSSCTPADDISYMYCNWFSSSSCTIADDISYMDFDWANNKIWVYSHMSKKSRVGRSALIFFFFKLSAKPEIVVPGSGI